MSGLVIQCFVELHQTKFLSFYKIENLPQTVCWNFKIHETSYLHIILRNFNYEVSTVAIAINPFEVIVFLIIQIDSFFHMFLKHRNLHHYLFPILTAFYESPVTKWTSKEYQVFFRNEILEKDTTVSKTNWYHLLFKYFHYGSLMGIEWPSGLTDIYIERYT